MKHLYTLILLTLSVSAFSQCCPCRTPPMTDCCPLVITDDEDNLGDPRVNGKEITFAELSGGQTFVTVGDVLNVDMPSVFFMECCDTPNYTPISTNADQNLDFTITGDNLQITINEPDFTINTTGSIPISFVEVGDTFDTNPSIQHTNFDIQLQACCTNIGTDACDTEDRCTTAITKTSLQLQGVSCSTGIVSEIISQTGVDATIDPSTGVITFNNFTDCEFSIQYQSSCGAIQSDLKTLTGTPLLLESEFDDIGTNVGVDVTVDINTIVSNLYPGICSNLNYSITSHSNDGNTNPLVHIVSIQSLVGSLLTVTGVQAGANIFDNQDRISVEICCADCPQADCTSAFIDFLVFP